MNRWSKLALFAVTIFCMGMIAIPGLARAAAPDLSLQQAVGQDDPTNSSPINFSLTANEMLVPGSVDASDFDISGGTLDSLGTTDNFEWTIAVTPTGDGPVSVQPSGTFEVLDQDEALAQSTVSGGTDRTVTYDSTAPTVTLQQANDQSDPTNNPNISFSFTSDEPLNGSSVEASDFDLTNATLDSITGSGDTFSVNVIASGDGNVSVAPSGTFAVSDAVGNEQTSAEGADRTVFVDSTAPDVSLQAAGGQADPTNDSAIQFELTSNENLSGGSVEVTDFVADNGTVDSVSGSGDTFSVSVTATDQGLVTLSPSGNFSVTDEYGNDQTSTTGGDPTVLYDTAPVVTLQQASGQADPTNSSSINFSLLSNEDLNPATVDASDFDLTNATIDSISGSGTDITVAVTAAGDGDVSIAPSGTFEVEDTNGNFPTSTALGTDRTVTYDITNPTVSIDTKPANPSRDATPTFTLSADEDATFECRVWLSTDSPPAFEACSDTFTSPFLAPGDYNFEARAIDTAGNTGSFNGYSWTIEPSGITGGGEDLYFTRGAEPVEYRILANDDQAGPLSYTFLNSVGGGTSSDFTVQPDGGTATFTPGNGFAGTDTLTVRVRNTDTNAFTDVTADIVVRPATRLLTGPAVSSQQLTNTATPTFTYDAVTGPGDGVVSGATFSCKVDNITQNSTACSTGSFTTATLSQGEHTFWVRAAKPGINVDPQPQQVTFTVDTIAPDAPTLLTGPEGLTNVNDASYTFGIPEGTAECRLVDLNGSPGPFSDCDSNTAQSYTDVPDGAYAFEVRTRDDAGNFSNIVSSNTLTIDTVVSVSIDSAPSDGNLDGKPAIEFSSSEDPDVTYECRLYLASTPNGEEPAYAPCTSPDQLPLLDKNVIYHYDVKATDLAGNTDVASVEWLQSNTAPAIAEPTTTLEAGTTAPINLGGTDADSDSLTYTVVGPVTGGTLGAIDNDTGLVDFTANPDAHGEYTFDYEVSDSRQGGTVSGTATVLVQPDTSFVNTPGNFTNDVTPTWTFDSPSGLTTFECSLDSAAWENCDGGSYTPSTDLAEGSHTLEVRTTDGALGDPTPASQTTEVDITLPDVSITSQPDALSNDTTPPFEFESTDSSATFECKVDDGEFTACVSGDLLAQLADGTHTFSVRALDPAGNRTDVPAEYTWEVDATNPVIALDAAPNGPGEGKQTNAKRPVWSFSTTDINLVDATINCWVDNQTPVAGCLSPFQPSANLADGTHTLHVTAEDGAGNIGNLDVSFKVNTLSASVAFSDTPDSPSGPAADFAFTASTDLGAEGYFECRTSLNGGAPGAWATCESPLHLTGLSSGTRKLEVRAVDSAGNASTGSGIASHTWTTIGGTPDTTITGSSKTGTTASFGFNSAGNPLATFECKLDSGAYSTCTSPKTYTGLSTGSHTFSVRAINQVGSTDASPATNTWSVSAPTAPNTNITSQPSASTAAIDASFAFASSAAVSTFECSLDDGDFAACESPKAYTGLAVGDHTFKVRATSGGMTDASPASVTWTIVTGNIDPPVDVVCNPRPESPVVTNGAKVSRTLLASVTVSHRTARAGQTVIVKLNGNAKKKKKLAKVLKSVVVSSGNGGTLATLKGKSWTSSFTVTDSQGNGLSVSFKRKKGKAIKKPAAFTALPACPAE